MKQRTATIVGFLIASIFPAMGIAMRTHIFLEGIIFYPVSLFLVLIFGLPAFLLVGYFKLISWWSSAMAGFLISALLVPGGVSGDGFFFPIFGAVTGFVFWLIWRLGNDGQQDGDW